MSLAPLLATSPVIQLHAFGAIAAFGLGAWLLFSKKGNAAHRRYGRVWAAHMAIVALSSFFIWEIRMVGLFSPIHLLSITTLVALLGAIHAAREGNIVLHKSIMQQLYLGALIIAGFFTFMPGRIMHQVLFGDAGAGSMQWIAFLVGFAAILALGYALLRHSMGWRPPLTRR